MSADITSSISPSSCNTIFLLNNANASVIELISGQQAAEELEKEDDFVNNLSPFDLESRLHSFSTSTLQDYFMFIRQHIQDWDEASCRSISSCIQFMNTSCIDQLKLLTYPSRICIVQTDGKDENNAAYCRNENVIIIPKDIIHSPQLRQIFIHELFHIWSKWHTNLGIRDQLYASIGYHKIPVEKPIEFPASLHAVKITNPDAPNTMKYYIQLEKYNDETGKRYTCTPILYASQAFDANFSTNFFDYLVATTLILDDTTYQPLQPLQFISYEDASTFYDQIGNNTPYIIHPEEILADNFVLWMMSKQNSRKIETPAVVARMNNIISLAANNARVNVVEANHMANSNNVQ